MKSFYLPVLICLSAIIANAQCDDDRYRNFDYFSGSTVTQGVQFGVNESVPPFGSSQGTPQVLRMDVYEPIGDTLSERPVVLVAFGGSFIGGERSQVEFLCREFCKLGYVAVAPDYRVGLFFPINEVQTTLAVLRGAHDMKGCVRYLRQTVAEDGNPYRINPDMIIVGGVSAGAISAIHAAYLDDIETEIPEYLVNDTAGLGGLEGLSGPDGYSSEVQAVFSYSGAIGDTSWIEDFDSPIISFHEEGDPTVPYLTQEVAVSGIPTGLIASGSFDLHIRAENAGMDQCFHGYPGNGHVGFLGPDSLYADVLGKTADFLADVVCAEVVDCGMVQYPLDTTSNNTSVIEADFASIEVYPVPASNSLQVNSTKSQVNVSSWELIDTAGRVCLNGAWIGSTLSIDVSRLDKGVYSLRMLGENQIGIRKVLIQ